MKLRTIVAATIMTAAVLSLCVGAQAEATHSPADPRGLRLSDRGRVLLALDVSGGISNDSVSPYGSYYQRWFTVLPSLLYFVRDGVGLGVYGGGGAGSTGSGIRHYDAVVGVQALLDWRISPSLSLYAIPSFGYSYQSVTQDVSGLPSVASITSESRRFAYKRDFLRMSVSAPLVFHPVPNVAIGLGPELLLDVLLRDDDNTERLRLRAPNPRYRLALASFFAASF